MDRLGRDLPVLLENEQWEEAGEELDDIFIGDAEIWYELERNHFVLKRNDNQATFHL